MIDIALKLSNSPIKNIFTMHVSWWIYNQLGMNKNAILMVSELIASYPDIEIGYDDYGDTLLRTKNYNDAINYYQKALNAPLITQSDQVYLFEQLAVAYHEIGDEPRSRVYYQKAFDLYKSYWIPKYLEDKVNGIKKLLRD
jgi:tetratricopeptide (TPR) repeat protein